jgi:hypothetical protein
VSRTDSEGIFKTAVDGVIGLAFALRHSQKAEAERFALLITLAFRSRTKRSRTYASPEILAFTLLNGRIQLEVAEVFQVQTFILARQLLRLFFTSRDDSFYTIFNNGPVSPGQ